jgi:hypothetical protein
MNDLIKIEDYKKGISIEEREDTITTEFLYPRSNQIKFIEVGLCDVRATDNIRISYDFDRDGWKIEQSYINEIDKGSYIDAATNIWEETAFLPSWNLEEKGIKLQKLI